ALQRVAAAQRLALLGPLPLRVLSRPCLRQRHRQPRPQLARHDGGEHVQDRRGQLSGAARAGEADRPGILRQGNLLHAVSELRGAVHSSRTLPPPVACADGAALSGGGEPNGAWPGPPGRTYAPTPLRCERNRARYAERDCMLRSEERRRERERERDLESRQNLRPKSGARKRQKRRERERERE